MVDSNPLQLDTNCTKDTSPYEVSDCSLIKLINLPLNKQQMISNAPRSPVVVEYAGLHRQAEMASEQSGSNVGGERRKDDDGRQSPGVDETKSGIIKIELISSVTYGSVIYLTRDSFSLSSAASFLREINFLIRQTPASIFIICLMSWKNIGSLKCYKAEYGWCAWELNPELLMYGAFKSNGLWVLVQFISCSNFATDCGTVKVL